MSHIGPRNSRYGRTRGSKVKTYPQNKNKKQGFQDVEKLKIFPLVVSVLLSSADLRFQVLSEFAGESITLITKQAKRAVDFESVMVRR